MTFGERIRIFAKKCYGSQKNFAEHINFDYSYLNRIALGKNTPGADILQKFYEAGMSINWLLSGKGSMFADNSVGKQLMESFGDLDPRNHEKEISQELLLVKEDIKQLKEEIKKVKDYLNESLPVIKVAAGRKKSLWTPKALKKKK